MTEKLSDGTPQYQAGGGGNGCARCALLSEHLFQERERVRLLQERLHEASKGREYLTDVLEKIEALCVGVPVTPARRGGRRRREFTEVGVLIATAASSRGKNLAAVSRELGRADDWLARVCTGALKLTEHTAIVVGEKLGVDLLRFVPKPEPAPPDTGGQPEPPVDVTKGVGYLVGCATDHAVEKVKEALLGSPQLHLPAPEVGP